MELPNELSEEQYRALVEVIKIFARRGRAIREEREREQAENENRQDVGTASDSQSNSTTTEGGVVYGKV